MIQPKYFFAFLLAALILPVLSHAQQPAMHIKIFGGVNVSSFVYKEDTISTDAFFGYQGGAGLRVRKGSAFFEFDVLFTRRRVALNEADSISSDLRINQIEIPIMVGYVPIHGPLVKWYVSTGPTARFNTSAFLEYPTLDAAIRFKPGDIDLPTFGLGWNIGTQIDVAMFNFSAMYTIGMTNAVKRNVRTNSHSFQFNVGLLF